MKRYLEKIVSSSLKDDGQETWHSSGARKSLYFGSTLCVTSTAPQAFLLFWGLLNDLHAFKTTQSKFWKPSRYSSSTTILKSTIVIHCSQPKTTSRKEKVTCASHFHWGRTLSETWIIRTATRSIPRSNASSNWRRPVGCGWSWTLDVLDFILHRKPARQYFHQTEGLACMAKSLAQSKGFSKWSHLEHLAGCFMQGLRGWYYCYHYDLWNPWHTFTTRTKLLDWYQKTSGLEWDT